MRGPPALVATAAAIGATAAGVDQLGRRRLTRLQREVRRQYARDVAQLPTADDALVAVLQGRPEVVLRSIGTPVTDGIHARLKGGDVAAVEARLGGDPAELYAACDDATRRRLVCNFAAEYRVEEVLARAGVVADMPPENVHAMARGPIAAGGDFFLADLVFDALQHAGMTVAEGATVLDFGASTGRVLRAVAAGRPDLTCLGCDPNAGAMAWADEHLPMARFFVSPQRPPIELADGSLDVVYAISIWSHFAEEPALAWLQEMHRLLRPGGALLLTTHGLDCPSTLLRRGNISPETAAGAARSFLQGKLHFVDVFGPEGDWGVQDAGWGNAYFSVEWLLAHTGGDWTLELDWPGALDQVQDVLVLRRR